MTSLEAIKNTSCALLIIDVQNDFCAPDGSCARLGSDVSDIGRVIPHIKRAKAWADQSSVPVIFVQSIHSNETDSAAWMGRDGSSQAVCRPNTWGAEFYEVFPEAKDIIVNKHRYSAFINTRLDSVLRTLKVETLLFAGVASNVCVESSLRDGYMLDYKVVFLEDCCSGSSREAHEATINNVKDFFGTICSSAELASLNKV